jgi:putative acyl-CoA dehydrogenase
VDEGDRAFRRLATAVAKYWICKATPALVAEALESIGGNGYVEESVLPRLYRESPVNSLWEGAGSVNALDLLRAAAREPESIDALLDEIVLGGGVDARLDSALDRLRRELARRDPGGRDYPRATARLLASLAEAS